VRTSFCKNLHAKCYLNEESCIITSLNLYEFSMVNNNEMGVLINRAQDVELYRDAYDEAQRIIRISEEVRISLERVDPGPAQVVKTDAPELSPSAANREVPTPPEYDRLTSAKLAAKLGIATKDLLKRFTEAGFLELKGERHYVSPTGKQVGIEWRPGPGGGYLLWPAETALPG
jgi:hypothetical protein